MKFLRFLGFLLFFELITSIPVALIGTTKNFVTLFIIIAVSFLAQCGFVLTVFKYSKYTLKDFSIGKSDTLNFVFFAVLMLLNQIFFIILNNNNLLPANNNNVGVFNLVQSHKIVLTIYFAIIAPILEELLFRGVYYLTFIKEFRDSTIMEIGSSWRYLLVIIFNGLLFAFLHNGTFDLNSVNYFVGGLILSLSYLKTKKISVPIGLHILNNILTMLV